MAKPIKDTPLLKGEDAILFLEEANNVVPVSLEEKIEAEKLFKEVVANNPEIFSLV
ncbi:MAG: hypothetical protein R3Y61_04445 [Rikenellaceae bacterium]